MDLQAKANEAELHALHWQMAYEDQRTCYRQLDERFGMSIEESASMHDELRRQQRDLSKMIHVDTLKIYQQKIAFLEDQVHDTKQQIACDHEQFLYEQTKWKLEKKHLGKEVEEIQDVSVKVLKLLLIREKLLKKQERAHATRVASWHNHCGSLKTLTAKLMQECALILVVLQEHAITISNLGNNKVTAQTFPVKPVQIKKMIKRLKNIDWALVQLAAAGDAEQSCCSPSDEADHLLSDDVATSVR
uniref:Cilia- and flagella-associated protein 157 n=1 Tax=Globisporangium ultimum (strain ATCC 200006 / CBS 805.95 / DAOM BR144) TaxID=431595 RepID=K3WAG3_GLOUD